MINKALFTSNKDDWETPQDLYNQLDAEFKFTCDVAASEINHKHKNYFTKEKNGLTQNWHGVCWCNPPYGSEINKWFQKANEEAASGRATTVMLIPARTDTRYFHDYIYNKHEIRFLKGRLKFSNSKNSAHFPSMVVIFRKIKVVLK